ncbi:MAG TPA: response regulator [Thermoanaerobaculia bacterium]|nr:response regulator [Thermoanaerobaculia bacterium]
MNQPRALIIDDDDPIRTMLSMIVRHQGISVDTARDGGEAIESLDRDGYNLVVLDLMMPRVDGYAVLAHMRAHQPELLPCTILATAVPERELQQDAQDDVYMVHTKPFDMQRFIADIRHCAHLDAA